MQGWSQQLAKAIAMAASRNLHGRSLRFPKYVGDRAQVGEADIGG